MAIRKTEGLALELRIIFRIRDWSAKTSPTHILMSPTDLMKLWVAHGNGPDVYKELHKVFGLEVVIVEDLPEGEFLLT